MDDEGLKIFFDDIKIQDSHLADRKGKLIISEHLKRSIFNGRWAVLETVDDRLFDWKIRVYI